MPTPFIPTSNEERAAAGDIFAYGGNMINGLNNTTTPVAPTVTKSPTVLSTQQGANYVQKDQQTLAKLSGIDTRYQLQPGESIQQYNDRVKQYYSNTPQPTTTTPKTEPGKITYINPNTEQSQTFDISSLTPDNVATLKSQGYQIAESNGSVPSWVLTGNTELGKAQQDLKASEDAFNALKNDIGKYTISDADLQNQINAITAQWDSRINDMKEINRRREQSLETTGVRLGSRYTGGAGGVFGGIVSEEERQGVARIGELEAQKQAAISAAKEAARTKNWELYSKQVGLAEQVYQSKLKAVDELNRLAVENNKKIQESQVQSNIDSAISSIFSQGIKNPVDILNILSSNGINATIKDVTGFIDNVVKVEAGQKFQGVVGEWKDAITAGAIPQGTSLFDYLNQKDPTKALQLQKLGLDVRKLQSDLRGSAGDKIVGTAQGSAISDAMHVLKFPNVSDRKDAQAFVQDLLAQGRIDDAREALLSYTLNSATTKEQDVISGKDDSIHALARIQSGLDDFSKKGGNTNIFKGLTEAGLEKLGTTLNPKLATLGNEIAMAIIDYRHAVSGAAFTESEAKQYSAIFPSIGNTPELNSAKISQLISRFESDKANFLKRKIGETKYNTIFGNQSIQSKQSSNNEKSLSDEEAFSLYLQQLQQPIQ